MSVGEAFRTGAIGPQSHDAATVHSGIDAALGIQRNIFWRKTSASFQSLNGRQFAVPLVGSGKFRRSRRSPGDRDDWHWPEKQVKDQGDHD